MCVGEADKFGMVCMALRMYSIMLFSFLLFSRQKFTSPNEIQFAHTKISSKLLGVVRKLVEARISRERAFEKRSIFLRKPRLTPRLILLSASLCEFFDGA
jgi:hypothetical protein